MGPYRTTQSRLEPAPDATGDDRMLAGVMAATGVIPVTLAIAEHQTFGAQASLGLLLLVLGLAGLLRPR